MDDLDHRALVPDDHLADQQLALFTAALASLPAKQEQTVIDTLAMLERLVAGDG